MTGLSLTSDGVETKSKLRSKKKKDKLKNKSKTKSFITRSFTSNVVDSSSIDLTTTNVDDSTSKQMVRFPVKKETMHQKKSSADEWNSFDSSMNSMNNSSYIPKTVVMHDSLANNQMMDRLRRTHSIYSPENPLISSTTRSPISSLVNTMHYPERRLNSKVNPNNTQISSYNVQFNHNNPILDTFKSQPRNESETSVESGGFERDNIQADRYIDKFYKNDPVSTSQNIKDDDYYSEQQLISYDKYNDDKRCSSLDRLTRNDSRIINFRNDTHSLDKLRYRRIKRKPKKTLARVSSNSMVVAAFSTDIRNQFTKHQLPNNRKKIKRNRYKMDSRLTMNRKSIISINYDDNIVISKRSKITLSKYDLNKPIDFGYRNMMFSRTDLSEASSTNMHDHRSYSTISYGDYDDPRHDQLEPNDNITSIDREVVPAFEPYDSVDDDDYEEQLGQVSIGQRYAVKGVMRQLPITPSDIVNKVNNKYEPRQVVFEEKQNRPTRTLSTERILSYQNISPIGDQRIHEYYSSESDSEDYSDIFDAKLHESDSQQYQEYTNADMLEELDDMQKMLNSPRASETLLSRPSSYYTRLTFDDGQYTEDEIDIPVKYQHWSSVFESNKHDIPLQNRLKNVGENSYITMRNAKESFDLKKFADVPAFALERFKSINEKIDIGEVPTKIDTPKEILVDIEEKKSVGKLPMVCSQDHLAEAKLPAKYTPSSRLSLKTISQMSIGSMPGLITNVDISNLTNLVNENDHDKETVNINDKLDVVNVFPNECNRQSKDSELIVNVQNEDTNKQCDEINLTSQHNIEQHHNNNTSKITNWDITKNNDTKSISSIVNDSNICLIDSNIHMNKVKFETILKEKKLCSPSINKSQFKKDTKLLKNNEAQLDTSLNKDHANNVANAKTISSVNNTNCTITKLNNKKSNKHIITCDNNIEKDQNNTKTKQFDKATNIHVNTKPTNKESNLILNDIRNCKNGETVEENVIKQNNNRKITLQKPQHVKELKNSETTPAVVDKTQCRITKQSNKHNLTRLPNIAMNHIETSMKKVDAADIVHKQRNDKDNNKYKVNTNKIRNNEKTKEDSERKKKNKNTEAKEITRTDPLFAIITGDSKINIGDINNSTRKENRLACIKSAMSSKPERVNSMPNRILQNNGGKQENHKMFSSQIPTDNAVVPFDNTLLVEKICGDILKKNEIRPYGINEKRSFQIINQSKITNINNLSSPMLKQQFIVNAMKEIKFEHSRAFDHKQSIIENLSERKNDNNTKKREGINNDTKTSTKSMTKTIKKQKKNNAIWNRKGKESVLKKVSSLTLKERRKSLMDTLKMDSLITANHTVNSSFTNILENRAVDNTIHRMIDTEKQKQLNKLAKLKDKNKSNNIPTFDQSTQVRSRQISEPQVMKIEENKLNIEIDELKKENEYSKLQFLEMRKSTQNDIQQYKNIIDKLIHQTSEVSKDKSHVGKVSIFE